MLSAIIKEENGLLILQTQYNYLLAKLLNDIPKNECQFRAENRCYYIHIQHKDTIIKFLDKLGYQTTFLDSKIPDTDDSYSILGLKQTAVKEVCEAAYKTLVKINHPDMGGNTETMQQITEAWNKIKIMRGF